MRTTKKQRPLSFEAQERIKNLLDAARDEVLAVEHGNDTKLATQNTNVAAASLGEYVRRIEEKVRYFQLRYRTEVE